MHMTSYVRDVTPIAALHYGSYHPTRLSLISRSAPGPSQVVEVKNLIFRGEAFENPMADKKRLAFSIIQYLHDQLRNGGLSSDAQESLEVAIQCLETAFDVSIEDRSLAIPQTLPDIFSEATYQISPPVNSGLASPSEDDISEAERLKSEGNEQMKLENFESAVSFYTKALDLNPTNAVYFCNRAAAYSKLGNYAGAVRDCEEAITIDPSYSKAYGRMGLNKHAEAVGFYKRALELDPENETYKSNLKIAEQKMKEMPSPMGAPGGFDLAGLLNNPSFMSMASNLMNNPQVQQLMSGMISGSNNPMSGAAAAATGNIPPNDLAGLIQAGQQFAQQMQQQNPELIEALRSQIRSRPPSASHEEQNQ
ncbi:hypothetical protein GDO86_000983 [Hymenochirus boettgeri]|uniref:Small glutamine-rich tetratricopeptide repeat-containing protein alpha n=1 Tax=Hymenochirus boettgeri TaxID=247094 RepID=A0A8T2KD13_9PIPI|nr:hypothetical protein GDO86_000983 [Hymenochirus boettgeri]